MWALLSKKCFIINDQMDLIQLEIFLFDVSVPKICTLSKKGLLSFSNQPEITNEVMNYQNSLTYIDYTYIPNSFPFSLWIKVVEGLGKLDKQSWLKTEPSNSYLHNFVIETYNFHFWKINWSVENATFCYQKIIKPCRRQVEENHPIW